jgi:2,4'-dihydroxyacetophenone dioxygenase
MTAATQTMYHFDDRHIAWRKLGDFTGFVASILYVDEASNTVEFIVKFDPNTNSLAHRHLAATYTFVIEGAHIIYELDGRLRDSRPTGRFTFTPPDGDCHTEGGGADGCVLLYSIRGHTDALFDLLDATGKTTATLRTSDFKAALAAQG